MALAAVGIIHVDSPDPYDRIRISCELAIAGGPSPVYTFSTYVAFDASDEDINAALIADAIAEGANHSLTVTSVRLFGGAMSRLA